MFIDKELKANKDFIRRKKSDVLSSKGGSDADYIRDLQTLIVLNNAVDERVEIEKGGNYD